MAFDIQVPDVLFKTRREIDEAPGFEWYDLTSEEIFANKRVVVFGLPGAFTPTCSSTHLPGYGLRSWRYSMVVDNGVVEAMFVEPGLCDNADGDPFEISDVYTLLGYLNE